MTEREKPDRQDFADNAIHNLMHECLSAYSKWQREHIAAVRDAVSEVTADRLYLTITEEFYPYA